MRSRFMKELPTPEIEQFLRAGGKTALIPVGCVEMHGLHCPIGTDSLIAEAFCLLVAEAGNGLVFPTIEYTWAGSTDGFAGTISVEAGHVEKLAVEVARKAWRTGFRQVVLVSVHHTNHYPLFVAARHLFETDGIPAMYLRPAAPLSDEAERLIPPGNVETSLLLGALEILGKGSLYSESEMQADETCPPSDFPLAPIQHGVVGSFMQDERQHVQRSPLASAEAGRRFLEAQCNAVVPEINKLDAYAKHCRGQKNQGTWR